MIQFTDEEIYEAVANNLPKVTQYVSSHGGGISFLGVKDSIVYIKLVGACSGCSMSLMTTKMVVQKELRALIHPELNVVNVDGTAENEFPTDAFVKESEVESEEKKDSVIGKVKDFLHI